jgi:hypothetical protein
MLFSFDPGDLGRTRGVDVGVMLRARLSLGVPKRLYTLKPERDGVIVVLGEYGPSKLNSARIT